MKTIFHIVSRIQQRLSNNVVTDESVGLQYIEDLCHLVRLTLAKKTNNKSEFYQKICCLPVECETVECDGMILENIQVINIPAAALDFELHLTTLSVEDKESYIFLGKDKNKPKKNSRLMKQLNQHHKSFTIINNNKIVVYDDEPIEFLCVSAIFSNPFDEQIASCLDGNRTEIDYPMPSASILLLEDTVYKMIVNNNRINESNDGSKKVN